MQWGTSAGHTGAWPGSSCTVTFSPDAEVATPATTAIALNPLNGFPNMRFRVAQCVSIVDHSPHLVSMSAVSSLASSFRSSNALSRSRS
eukprot:9230687-Pyramimonas_sp.AAC.1